MQIESRKHQANCETLSRKPSTISWQWNESLDSFLKEGKERKVDRKLEPVYNHAN